VGCGRGIDLHVPRKRRRQGYCFAWYIGTSLTVGAGMLSLALVIALVVRPRRAADVADDNRARRMALAGARAGKSGRA
jgi:hypothetical protein